jgi:uncharacterized protein involved in response to NO
MTGILILSIAFAAIAVVGLVGLLASRIVSSMNRRKLERTRSRPASPAYRMPELTADVVEREMTIYVPLTCLNDPVQRDRVVDGARGVPVGM